MITNALKADISSHKHMDTFTDRNCNMQFCTKICDPRAEIADYHLIDWCKQYLSKEGTFVDIGADIGSFSIILSKLCKEVVAFEGDKSLFDCLSISTIINDRFNIKLHNESFTDNTLDSYHLTHIDFLRINSEDKHIIDGMLETLTANKFPKFIIKVIKNTDLLNYIKELGYKIYPVGGCTDIYLASDHKLPESTKEDDNSAKYDFTDLCQKYDNNKLQDVSWDTWHALATHYRKASKHQKSFDCACIALKIAPYNEHHKVNQEIAIVARHIDKKSEGYNACESIVNSHYAPWAARNSALNNQSHYMKSLPFKKVIVVNYDLPHDYIGSSSSLVPNGDGYQLNLRGVNYSINSMGGYIIRDPSYTVRSRNFLLTLDHDLNIIKGIEVTDKSGVKTYPVNIKGLEDIRLFGDNEFFCTYLEINESRTPQMCYCKYDPETGDVTSLIPLMVGDVLQCEKNWMPFIKDDDVHFIYTLHPLRLYKLDRETGKVSIVKDERLSDFNIDMFRGSASVIPYKEGWLTTIHEVYHSDPRKYFHRFVYFTKEFTKMKYSDVYYFESPSIEYNLSICHSEDGLIMTYSQNDNSSKIGIVDYSILDEWLSI